MPMIARGLLLALAVTVAASGGAFAEARGELAPLAAWAGKSQQKAQLDGKVARALGFNQDGRPMQLVAVTTAYLDGARSVHLFRGPAGEQILFSQGQATRGQWYLTNRSGALLRALEWAPTSANPQPLSNAAAMAVFTETKSFWKNQLGRPVR